MKPRLRTDPQALDFGKYWLTDASNKAILGGQPGVELDDVEAWLNSYVRK